MNRAHPFIMVSLADGSNDTVLSDSAIVIASPPVIPALHDFGGTGATALLLPGLCGHAQEWASTAAWLKATHHVYALDPRGHGANERRPADVSRDAHIADTAAALAMIGPSVVIGQSMGGHTAFLTAAAHPELVTRLVLAEAGPDGPSAGDVDDVDGWLAAWPAPFQDRATAAEFLGGGFVGPAWAAGLVERPDGFYPAFDRDIMTATLAAMVGPRWDEFAKISCPTLVVRGSMNSGEYHRMLQHPLVDGVEIPDGGHDVHLDSPVQWRAAVTSFLAG